MTNKQQTVFIVDDDEGVRDALSMVLDTVGQAHELFSSAPEFLESYDESKGGCLVLDIRMPRMSGLDQRQWVANSEPACDTISESAGHVLSVPGPTEPAYGICQRKLL